ncbi:MAG: hypothetical protein V7695_02990 [Sulfitobacter sp.]
MIAKTKAFRWPALYRISYVEYGTAQVSGGWTKPYINLLCAGCGFCNRYGLGSTVRRNVGSFGLFEIGPLLFEICALDQKRTFLIGGCDVIAGTASRCVFAFGKRKVDRVANAIDRVKDTGTASCRHDRGFPAIVAAQGKFFRTR